MVRISVVLTVAVTTAICSGPTIAAAVNPDAGASEAEAKLVTFYLTAEDQPVHQAVVGRRAFKPLVQPDESQPAIIIDPAVTFQTILGFGGAFTDATCEVFAALDPAQQEKVLTACFDEDEGNGYSMCRTTIHSCDFASESYTYAEVPGDTTLEHFSIAHDEQYRIPFIKRALAETGGELKLFASPWSPPAWMKTNNDMLHGGKLKPEYFQTWADYFVKYVQAYEAHGIPLWGLTVQNEPMAVQIWESCVYTAEEERDFVREYLGPTLTRAGLLPELKLMIWDHNRGIMYQRAKVVYDDPEASQYVWGAAFHWYVGDHYDNVRMVHDAFPDKQLLYSEAAIGPFKAEHLHRWSDGAHMARSMIHDLNNWATAWVHWNMILDQTGGPVHVPNPCFAPVIVNTETQEVTYRPTFYYFGHFSRFIRPGAQRIACTSTDDRLLATAATDQDGAIVVVVLNDSDEEIQYGIWLDGRWAQTTSPANSIMTAVLENDATAGS